MVIVIRVIREKHNIVGTPVGTLLQLPTQNLFLGPPIEYSSTEIALLHSRNVIKILNGKVAASCIRTKPRQLKSSPYDMFLDFPKDRPSLGTRKFLPQPPEKGLPDPQSGTQEVSKNIPRPRGVEFLVYEYLNRNGYWMTPGLRFGCEFTAYPGDPLRYHSHFMVHVEREGREGVEMLSLVGGGRVATQTRKAWMLVGEVDGEVRVFSIEWAAFG
jgi:tRNA-splicing endonuclease subunit Sen34